jgi:dienelactone hydrolase
MRRAALAVLIALIVAAPCAAQTAGTEVTVPLTVKGLFGDRTIELVATEYRPEGAGPFPAIVLSHGSPNTPAERVGYTAKYAVASAVFVKWGFVVLNPVRRGYGKTGGAWEEGFGSCNAPFYVEAGLETAKDIRAAVTYLRGRADVDRDRIVLVGQSAGGWGSLAAASESDLPIRGVVNFAGGRGGRQGGIANNNCAPDRLVAAAGTLGKRAKVPTLWLYTTNDQFFGPELSRRLYEAYAEAGGHAAYHLLPAIGNDGHNLITMSSGVPLWQDKVATFLREIGVLAR